MLLDDSVEVVVNVGTHHEAILGVAVHRLCIDVVLLLVVLHEPALLLEEGEVGGGLLVYTGVVLVGAYWEIDLRLDDMVERHLVALGLGTRLVGVEHIVWAALHLLYQSLGWADALEWFYYCHDN